jgi:hypothetical protein
MQKDVYFVEEDSSVVDDEDGSLAFGDSQMKKVVENKILIHQVFGFFQDNLKIELHRLTTFGNVIFCFRFRIISVWLRREMSNLLLIKFSFIYRPATNYLTKFN